MTPSGGPPKGVSSDSAIWFVELNGQRNGPMSLERIADAFHSGQLQSRQKVTSEELPPGKWMTVEEAAQLYQRRTGTGTIQLPPRPPEVVQANSDSPVLTDSPTKNRDSDPATSLFEVLQSVKERRPALPRAQVVSDPSASATFGTRRKVPGQAWLILTLTLVLGGSVWAIATFLKKTGEALPVAQAPSSAQTATQPGNLRPASAPAGVTAIAIKAPVPPAPKFTPKPFTPATRPNAPRFTFTPPARSNSDDRDSRDNDRDREREERDREERDARERDERDRDPRDWRARDGNDPVMSDSYGGIPGTDPQGPNLRPAPPAAPPPHSPSDEPSLEERNNAERERSYQ